MTRSIWPEPFTIQSWHEFREQGASVVSSTRLPTVQYRIEVGDYLLCYLTELSCWVGVLKVTDQRYHVRPKRHLGAHLSQVMVEAVMLLDPQFGVAAADMPDGLRVFRNLTNPDHWVDQSPGSRARRTERDSWAVVEAVERAVRYSEQPKLLSPPTVEVVITIAEAAAGGVLGTYIVAATNRVVARVLGATSRKSPPPRPRAVRAAAQWAINERYDEILPAAIQPTFERIDQSGNWQVVYDHDGFRYSAARDSHTWADVIVQRERL